MTDTPAAHAVPNAGAEPSGDLCIRTLAMPADTNANGDIFGGWLLGQMDVGGGVFASKVAKSRTVTVAIEAMSFRGPSMSAIWSRFTASWSGSAGHRLLSASKPGRCARREMQSILVTEGNFTYVSIDDQGHPQAIKRDETPIST